MEKSKDFLSDLRAEIRASQEHRASFVRQKILFVISLLGIGNIKFQGHDLLILVYVAPIIALVFDLYILGEVFGIRRAGAFLYREKSVASDEEKRWEQWVENNRDPFSKVAGPLLSINVLVIATIVIWRKSSINIIFWAWFVFNLTLIFFTKFYSNAINKRLFEDSDS